MHPRGRAGPESVAGEELLDQLAEQPRLGREVEDRVAPADHLRAAIGLPERVEPEPDLVKGVAGAMRDFMVFHEAHNLVIEKSNPPAFGEKLLAAI